MIEYGPAPLTEGNTNASGVESLTELLLLVLLVLVELVLLRLLELLAAEDTLAAEEEDELTELELEVVLSDELLDGVATMPVDGLEPPPPLHADSINVTKKTNEIRDVSIPEHSGQIMIVGI